MAKPDTDDGWIKKACELEAALDFADFPKYCRVILRYVFAQIFGRGNRPDHAIIPCLEIARRIGCRDAKRKVVRRALDQLIAGGVLSPVDGIADAYRFNKDYEEWTQVRRLSNDTFLATAEKLISRAEVDDCKAAPDYARSFAIACDRHPRRPQPGMKTSPTGDAPTAVDVPNGGENVPNGGRNHPQRGTFPAPLNNPLLGTEFQSTENITGFALSAGAESPAAKAPKKAAKQPRLPLAPLPTTEASDDALAAWVRGMFRNREHGERAVLQAATWRGLNYPEPVIREALSKAVRVTGAAKLDALLRYAESVLAGWAEKRTTLKAAPIPAASAPVAWHRADPSRPRPTPPSPNPEPRS